MGKFIFRADDFPHKPANHIAHRYAVTDKDLYHAQRGRCFYCEGMMAPRTRDPLRDSAAHLARRNINASIPRVGGYTYDHVYPKVLGYSLQANSVLSCQFCNSAKGSILPDASIVGRAILVYASMGKAFAPAINKKSKEFQALWKYIHFIIRA